jgi:MoaA/NifB/PqqE/SkfB family radical SAM enzyme
MRTHSPGSYPEPSYVSPKQLRASEQAPFHDTKWQIVVKNARGAVHSLLTYYTNKRRLARNDYKLKPLIASYYVTHRCNLKCVYCTEHYPIRDTVDLDTEGAFEIVRRLRREMSAIYFTGGEPLVRPDIVKIVREAARLKFFPIYLGTNGVLLPLRDEVVDYIDRLVISLDSMDPESWDAILNAGRGQANRVYEVISHYAKQQRKRDFSIMLNCVITRDSIEQVYRVMEFCFKHDVVFAPVAAAINSLPDPALMGRADYQRLAHHIVELKRRGYPILGSADSIETLLFGKPFPCYATLLPHVYPNGDVFYPCQPLGRIGGNLLELGSIAEVYKEGEKKFGAWKECWRGCALNCYVLTSYFIHHFWDQMVWESGEQFAMRSGTAKPGSGERLPAAAALEPLSEDSEQWKAGPLPEWLTAPRGFDVPISKLSASD